MNLPLPALVFDCLLKTLHFSVGILFVLKNLEFLMRISVSGLEPDILVGPIFFFYFKTVKVAETWLHHLYLFHPTQDISTWSLVFHLHVLLVLSSLEENIWPVLLAAFPVGLQLICYVHSPWSSEASADLCPTSLSAPKPPLLHTGTEAGKSSKDLERGEGAGDRLPEGS